MTTLTAIEIATNYPDNIKIVAMQHKETLKWGSFMFLMRGEHVHKMMLSFDIGENNFEGFDTEEEAKTKMEELAQAGIEFYNEKFGK